MRRLMVSVISFLTTVQSIAQSETITDTKSSSVEPLLSELIAGIILPIIFISFLVFMLVSLVRYFLEYRLKNKLIDRGMAEQLSTYLLSKNDQEKQNETIKLAILFCGVGTGLTVTYFTAPINIHSLAIMAFSLGLSYLTYFFYLRSRNT